MTVSVTIEGLEVSIVADRDELLAAGLDCVIVMISAEEPGPPGTVTVNTGASDSVVDTGEGDPVAERVGADVAAPVPTVVCSVRVKLAVLTELVDISLVATGDAAVVARPLSVSTTV